MDCEPRVLNGIRGAISIQIISAVQTRFQSVRYSFESDPVATVPYNP